MSPNYDLIVHGGLYSADFDKNTLTFKIQGDMPRIGSGRFTIVDFDKFGSIIRQAKLWADGQKSKRDGSVSNKPLPTDNANR